MNISGKNISPGELAVIVLLGGIILAGFVYLISEIRERNELQQSLATATTQLNEKEAEFNACQSSLLEMEQAYSLVRENASELLSRLNEEKERNEEFSDQIDDLSGTVGKLDKLSRLDPELLQKYSKVYFLNEHYAPSRFREIDDEYLFRQNEPEHIHAQVAPFLEDLMEEARDDNIDISVLSAFRSFEEQGTLKGAYTVTYGTGANTFSAEQGYSEHQLGTTVDFTTSAVGAGLTGFQDTEAYEWLLDNAHKYGFTLSYPEGNTYYVFEPWHWRFVGEDLARDLYEDGKHFYDFDQRTLDGYLISIFD